jgi:ferredoxin/flavodoxin
MKIEKIFAVYFSGTGTTKAIVTQVAKGLSTALDLPISEIDLTDLVVIGLPVYAGRLPNLILPYIKTMQGNGSMAVPIVLYGNRNYDDALMELKTELEKNEFHAISAGTFIGEHSFSKVLAAGRPDAEDLRSADSLADKTAQIIHHLSRGNELIKDLLEVKGNMPLHAYYTPRDRKGNPIDIRKVKPKINENCINCGKCIEMCPMGAIDSRNPALVSGTCIKCCACIKRCPLQAKYFDDQGYVYHMHELEEQYGATRNEPELFSINL